MALCMGRPGWPFSHILIWKLTTESMKYMILLQQFNWKRFSDFCLDNELPSQPGEDKVSVVIALRVTRESCSVTSLFGNLPRRVWNIWFFYNVLIEKDFLICVWIMNFLLKWKYLDKISVLMALRVAREGRPLFHNSKAEIKRTFKTRHFLKLK